MSPGFDTGISGSHRQIPEQASGNRPSACCEKFLSDIWNGCNHILSLRLILIVLRFRRLLSFTAVFGAEPTQIKALSNSMSKGIKSD